MWVDPQDEEQKQNGQTNLNSPSVGAGGGVAPASGTTGNPSTINPVQPAPQQQQFATVQDYLGANKQQGEQLGQQFTSKLSDSLTNEKGAIDSSANQAKNDITAGTTNFDSGLVSKAAADPTSVANDPNQLGSFLKQWNAAYTGPASFESSDVYSGAANAGQEASQKAALTKDAGGQQQILHDDFGVYGQGNQGLDQAILQNSSASPTIQDQSKQFSNVGDYLKNTASDVDAKAKAASDATAAAKTNTQGAFTGALSGFQNDLGTRTAAAQKTAQDVLAKDQADLASGDSAKVTADLKASGVDDATIKNVTDYLTALNTNYGIKPNVPTANIGNPSVDINNANVATRGDYDKAAALQKLTGVDYSGTLNPADVTKAGTATPQNTLFQNPANLSNYLKTGLDIQDKSLNATTPSLDWNAVNAGKVTSDQATKTVTDIAAAGQRQGVDPNTNPALQSIHSNAMQGLQAIYLGHENINTRPVAKVYADTAVAALMAKGSSQADAQASINKWIQQLTGNPKTPPIYK